MSHVHRYSDKPSGLTVKLSLRDAEELEESDAAGEGQLEIGLLGDAVERSGHELPGLVLDPQRRRNAAWGTKTGSAIMIILDPCLSLMSASV